MIKKILFVSCILVIGCCGIAHALLGELGVSPLNLEYGARPLGMGGSYAGLADDVNSAPYNPAGLAWVKGLTISFRDINNMGAMQAYPTGFGSSLGLAIITQKINGIPIAGGGTAASNSNIVVLSFGTKLGFVNRVALGINIKGLMSQTLRRTSIPDRSATGWDMDIGVLWKGEEWWSAGATLQNILPIGTLGGGTMRWDTGVEEGFPASLKIGGSARIIGDIGTPIFMEARELLLSGDIGVSTSGAAQLRAGAEWNFNKTYYLRTGYSTDLSFGLGYRNSRFGVDFSNHFDSVGNQRVSTFSFLYFPKEWVILKKLEIDKPKLILERPFEAISLEDNIVTYDDKLEVFGKVKPGVLVYINGLRVSLDENNAFKTMVPLRLKKNLIIVEAHFEGDKKTWKYKVLRKARVKLAEDVPVEAKQKVESLVTLGVIEITPEAEFVLETGITRGELATWIVKAAEMKVPAVEKDLFADVPKEHPLAPYIKAVTDLKLLRPFPDGTFRPQAVVLKEEGNAIFEKLGVEQ